MIATMYQTIFRNMKKWAVLSLLFLFPVFSAAQTGQTDGIVENTPSVHAFTNATIVVSPTRVLENATLVIRNGVIEAVGRNANVPADARVWDMTGKTLYPGFIDPHSNAGMQEPRTDLSAGAASWNSQIRAHYTAANEYKTDGDGSAQLRAQGFTTVHSVPLYGIFRGQTAVFNLSNGTVAQRLVRENVAQSMSLRRTNQLGGGYPTSAGGAIALIRQTLLDADWYERAFAAYNRNPQGLTRPEANLPLAALGAASKGNQPMLFETVNEEEVMRSLRFTEEFSIKPWIRGNGTEYRITDVLSQAKVPVMIPLDFPDAPNLRAPEDAMNQSLANLRHWYLAPENPARLAAAGVNFAFTLDGLSDRSKFLPNLRLAVHAGLNTETALAALTTNPASMLGINNTHGTLENGKVANIVVTNGDLFTSTTRIEDVWVDGQRFRVNAPPVLDVRGEWTISPSNASFQGTLKIEGRVGRLNGTITLNENEIKLASVVVRDQARRILIEFPGADLDINGLIRLSATVTGDELFGWAEVAGMEDTEWTGKRISTAEPETVSPQELKERTLTLTDIRPAMEFGLVEAPAQPQNLLIRNATIWTMGEQGVLENADMLITRGKVAQIGRNLNAPRNAVVVDAEGKHVTPGMIDAHLHSGIDGVNEVGNAIVPEVRMGDVLNMNNIWMYRQLAGGLTAAHVMHGSANPIGGQNEHIKMRWGALSNDLKIEGAPKTVKFALGENPKRVGSGRYPDTRMGVEQIISDRFSNALDYRAQWAAWERNKSGIPPRRDLRLEALLEMIDGTILIQSHSYRQDEILALMRTAERFGITVKAFHHGVEAYKVAPELAAHGAGAVVWSDWSSFKIEAYDGTLFNARILSEAGVLTSLHSDNSQIATRMNWEAAKMVRAGMDPVDALALVTINTAKLLGIDHRVGSLESGKDADFVIWNGDPLSTFTKAEQTWVDGRKYFDLETDAEMRTAIERERADLIKLILESR